MNLDFGTLCLLGVFIVVALLLIPRLMRAFGGGGTDYSQRGSERPTYDDPNISGGGSFGGGDDDDNLGQRGSERPTNNDPGVRGRGFFGGSKPSSGSGSSPFGGLSRRSSDSSSSANSPKVKGRGFFGGSKK